MHVTARGAGVGRRCTDVRVAAHRAHHEVELVRVAAVDGVLADSGAGGDALHGERLEPHLGEHVDRGLEDRLVGFQAARSTRRVARPFDGDDGHETTAGSATSAGSADTFESVPESVPRVGERVVAGARREPDERDQRPDEGDRGGDEHAGVHAVHEGIDGGRAQTGNLLARRQGEAE